MTTQGSESPVQKPGSSKAILTGGVFTSRSDDWATPLSLFQELDAEFGPLTLDVCADRSNAKCPAFYGVEADGLSQVWRGYCWMNPPYGRTISKWVQKAAQSHEARVVCLLPARTDTAWWHDWVLPHARVVRFLRGRVKFSGKGPAPFPSAVVVFR